MLDRMLFRIDPVAALQTGNYWAELYPQDPQARQLLAAAYGMQGDVDSQIDQYHALLAIDSTDVGSLQAIAGAFRGKEEYDSALVYYGRIVDLQPTDIQARIDIAATQTSLLRFDEARAELETGTGRCSAGSGRAQPVGPSRHASGNDEDAAGRLEEMSSLARTPQERDLVAGVQETYFYNLGQYGGLRKAYDRRVEALREYAPPIQPCRWSRTRRS